MNRWFDHSPLRSGHRPKRPRMKKYTRLLVFVLFIPVLAAGGTWGSRSLFDRWIGRAVLDCPTTIDLGDREFGEIAVGRFAIANRGRGELRVDNFFTTCSCAGVEREVDGRRERIESAVIPPGGHLELAVRVSVGALSGENQVVRMGFSCNDPKRPTCEILVIVPHVKGGVYPAVSAILFGEIRVGSAARRVIELYDNRQVGRRIEKVHSLQPDRFEARLLPLAPLESPRSHERGGQLMARLEVIAQTSKPGILDGAIEVSLAGESRQPDVIRVYGQVVSDIECIPSTLILPRRIAERITYSGQMLLRHRDGQRMKLAVDSAPPGITVKVRPVPENDFPWLLEVECPRPDSVQSGERTIRLRVRLNEGEQTFDVPVLLTI